MQPMWILLILQVRGFTASADLPNPPTPQQRVAQGQSTSLGEFPTILSLGLTSWANIYHIHQCGGSILTEIWVITAARCVDDAVEDVGRYYWLAGTNNLRESGVHHLIREVLIHPSFTRNDSLIHDIALTRVREPFEFSIAIQPMEISTVISGSSSVGTRGVVVGWGEVSQTLIQPDVLRSSEVAIIDLDICREVYSPWDLTILDRFQFCALKPDVELKDSQIMDRTACRGDEGGPIYYHGGNSPFVVLGFVSWTFGCTPSGFPTVYTNISAYLDWISDNTGYWI